VARKRGWIDEERAQGLTAAADEEVDRAVAFGRASDPITPAQAAELVYSS
jgi:TPP-dependent pyruvate/acetoin dehydrogenase alpha subunit